MAEKSLIEIEESRIRGHYNDAYALLEEFRHAPRKAEPKGGGSGGAAGSAVSADD